MTVKRVTDVDVFDDTPCLVGEGPAWDAATGEVHWVDIERRTVYFRALCGDGPARAVETPSMVGAALCRAAGGHLVSLADGPALLTDDGCRAIAAWADVDGGPRMPVRGNDAKCDPRGRAFLGTIELTESQPVAALYRLDPGAAGLVLIEPGVTVSNGLGWSPDGTTMYYVDSPTRRVDSFAYDVETGLPTRRTAFVSIPEGAGSPDGLSVDADGCIWVALWDGAAVHRYTPHGRLDRIVELPCPLITSCAFAGDDLSELIVTTAHRALADPPPEAGMTFRVLPGVSGLAVAPYAG